MASPFPPFPPPPPRGGGGGTGSRLPLVRRAGIAVFALAAVAGGLGHVIGWRSTGTAAAVIGVGFAVFLAVRRIRGGRRGPGLPPGLRGLPPGLRRMGPGRMPRGFPRGLSGPRGMGRLPRGTRLRGGAARGAHGGPLRAGRPASRMRSPGLPKAGRPAGGRRGLPFRSRGAGSAVPRAGRPGRVPRAGASRSRTPRFGTPRPGTPRAPGGALPRPGRHRRTGGGGGVYTPPRAARGWRRLVPPRLRPSARRSPRPGGGTAPPGTPRVRRWWRRHRTATPPRVRVRGGRSRWTRLPWRRHPRASPSRPAHGTPRVRPYRLRPFSRPWVLYHVGRYGRWRSRQAAARPVRLPLVAYIALAPALLLGGPLVRGWRKMRGSLIRWSGNRRRVPTPVTTPPAPASTFRPPADPFADRTPRAAATSTRKPAHAGPVPPRHQPTPTGGTPDMAVSAPVNAAVEAINHLFASFQPTSVMGDIDPMLEHLPDVMEAVKKGLTSLGEKLGDQPVHAAVTDAVRDLIPVAAGLEDASRQPYEIFKARHGQERDQHLNPRAGEKHWDTSAHA